MRKVVYFMSLKSDFIDYVESNFSTNPLPENLEDYWNTFKNSSDKKNKPAFTDNGKLILKFLQDYADRETWKAKDIAEELFISSRTVSGSIRKLVSDGYVEKVSQDPVIYRITEKGKEVIFED